LSRIAQAFVQYAEDYDGKFPRGVDPEDRNNPQMWNPDRDETPYGSGSRGFDYSNDARTAPMLHDLLAPYTRDRKVWRCPADIGWSIRARDENSIGNDWGYLRNIRPSSYARFGTSYYYYTDRGFSGWRPEDLREPSLSISLFDGDAWHVVDGQPTINALFADGHVQNLRLGQFNALSRHAGMQELRLRTRTRRLNVWPPGSVTRRPPSTRRLPAERLRDRGNNTNAF
jgi:prepilin-type processing-associated H-X9-DG protein